MESMAFLKEEMDNICKTLELNILIQEKLLKIISIYCRACSKSQLLQQENLKKKLSFLWIEKLFQFELIKCPGKSLSFLYRPNFAMSAVIKITESCQKTISVHFGTFTIKISGHLAGQGDLCR